MAINKRLLVKPPSTGITPSEHFGVVLYEGDGSSSHSINGGKFGAGAYFNGTSSKIELPTALSDGSTTDANCISFWFNVGAEVTSSTSSNEIMQFANSGSANGKIALGSTAGALTNETFSVSSDLTTQYTYSRTNIPAGWNHAVVQWNSGTTKWDIYINGVAHTTYTFGTNEQGKWALKFGNRSTFYYTGKLDQVRIFQRELSSSEVSTLYAETTPESLDPLSEDTTDTLQVLGDSSCIATYRFENDEVDLSGNYNGTGTEIQYAAGRYGQSADFNGGGNSYFEATSSPLSGYSANSTYSVSFWFNADNFNAQFPTLISGNTTSAPPYIWTDGSKIRFHGYQYGDYTATINANQWYHVVMINNGTSISAYINGSSVTLSGLTTWGPNSGNSLVLGGFPNSTSTAFDGKIDQVRIFNKALSAAEVTTLYNENSLVASYRFEGNANDDTRNNDGTPTNVTFEYGLGFTPDFVWIKSRSFGRNHYWYDTTRGANKQLLSNATDAEATITGRLSAFDTGGFTVGSSSEVNNSGETYVAWAFKANGGTTSSNTDGSVTSTVQANQDAGFSIVKWSGDDTAGTVGHGLSAAPEFVFIKRLDAATNWLVLETINNTGGYLDLDDSFTTTRFNSWFNSSSPSSTTVPLGAYSYTNGSNMIMYCFHSVDGFSKIGSYTGNGTTTGPMVETGFEPAMIIIKDASGTDNWAIVDNKRATTNPRQTWLRPNIPNAEFTNTVDSINFYSNGFQVAGGTSVSNFLNESGNTFIYMAFAADPDTEAPTVAKSFSTVTYDGNGGTQSIEGLGFQPNLVWIKQRDAARGQNWFDSQRGIYNLLQSNNTNANSVDSTQLTSFDSDGFTVGTAVGVNASGGDFVAWAFKADDNEPTIFGGPARAVYKFEDNANDVTTNYNGTASNITYSSSGKFNKAASFNGSSGKVEIAALNSFFNQKQTFSVSLWFKTTESSNNGVLFSDYANTSININATVVGSTGAVSTSTRYSGNTASFSSTETGLNDGNWHHFVYTSDKVTGKMYINGSLSNTVTLSTSGWNGDSNLIPMIGAKYEPQSSVYNAFFNGEIDQVRIYNGAIAQEQVTELYNETASQNDDLTLGGPPETIISANANAGFSIVKQTGNGGNATVPHGLSAVPELIIRKNLTTGGSGSDWWVYCSEAGTHKYGYLNHTDAFASNNNAAYSFAQTAPTATVFSVGNDYSGNLNNEEIIAYCFHSVSGYSKFGSYTGNGGTLSVNVGFAADFVMVKASSRTSNWYIFDSVRGDYNRLFPDLSNAESTSTNQISLTSTGFTSGNGGTNLSGETFIYMAFKIN